MPIIVYKRQSFERFIWKMHDQLTFLVWPHLPSVFLLLTNVFYRKLAAWFNLVIDLIGPQQTDVVPLNIWKSSLILMMVMMSWSLNAL